MCCHRWVYLSLRQNILSLIYAQSTVGQRWQNDLWIYSYTTSSTTTVIISTSPSSEEQWCWRTRLETLNNYPQCFLFSPPCPPGTCNSWQLQAPLTVEKFPVLTFISDFNSNILSCWGLSKIIIFLWRFLSLHNGNRVHAPRLIRSKHFYLKFYFATCDCSESTEPEVSY